MDSKTLSTVPFRDRAGRCVSRSINANKRGVDIKLSDLFRLQTSPCSLWTDYRLYESYDFVVLLRTYTGVSELEFSSRGVDGISQHKISRLNCTFLLTDDRAVPVAQASKLESSLGGPCLVFSTNPRGMMHPVCTAARMKRTIYRSA